MNLISAAQHSSNWKVILRAPSRALAAGPFTSPVFVRIFTILAVTLVAPLAAFSPVESGLPSKDHSSS